MVIEILRQTMLQGLVVRVGDVVPAYPADAKLLIGIGKAMLAATVEPVKLIPPKRRTSK
jgi:hypothetical protein